MVDPLSIAGLTIAVLDDLINLGIWTADLVQDARAFDDVCHPKVNLAKKDTRIDVFRILDACSPS